MAAFKCTNCKYTFFFALPVVTVDAATGVTTPVGTILRCSLCGQPYKVVGAVITPARHWDD